MVKLFIKIIQMTIFQKKYQKEQVVLV